MLTQRFCDVSGAKVNLLKIKRFLEGLVGYAAASMWRHNMGH